MMRLAVFRVDLSVKLQFDMVGCFLSIGVAGEGERSGLEVYVEGVGWDVRCGNSEDDVVLFGVGGGGALGPED